MNKQLIKDHKEWQSWMNELETFGKSDTIKQSSRNIDLILEKDKNLKNIGGLNKFRNRIEKYGPMPWDDSFSSEEKIWSPSDTAKLRNYLDRTYDICGAKKIEDSLISLTGKRRFHPVIDYLKSIKWDGKKRLATIFIDAFGVEDNEFTREASVLFFVGIIARVHNPGTKFDYMPILISEYQGIGKSMFWERISVNPEWLNSTPDSNLNSKDSALGLVGKIIVNFEELSAIRRADINDLKKYITTNFDSLRRPYESQTVDIGRTCLFVGNSNTKDILRDWTGNRRFWCFELNPEKNVKKWMEKLPKLGVETIKDHWKIVNLLTQKDYVGQLWAEAYNIYLEKYSHNEPLILTNKANILAEENAKKFMFKSAIYDAVAEFLDIELPFKWESYSSEDRIRYFENKQFVNTGYKRTQVSVKEIWFECFCEKHKRISNSDLAEIKNALESLGWEKVNKETVRVKGYGTCRNVYIKKEIMNKK